LVQASIDVLPFTKAPAEAEAPRPLPKEPAATAPLDELVRTSLAALPFTAVPAPAQSPASPAIAVPAPAETEPADDLLPVESFAVIKMQLWARPAGRLDVLERHGLCEGTWRFQELRHTEALELEARAGGWERASSLAAALQAAKALR